MDANSVISFETRRLSVKHKVLIDACRGILAEQLPSLFDFFGPLDDSLFKLAEQSRNNQQQEDYFIAMRQFRVQQEHVKQQFIKLVITDFDNFWTPSRNKPRNHVKQQEPSDVSELSLMQNDTLEEEIAIQKIITKAESFCRSNVIRLDTCFAELVNLSVEEINSPIALVNVIEHLQSSLAPLSDDISIKLLTYKQFEKHSMASLVDIYQHLTDELIEQGAITKTASYKRPSNPVSSPAPSSQSSVSNQDSELDDPEVFAQLRALLTSVSLDSSTLNQTMPTASQHSLVSSLSSLQNQATLQPSYDNEGKLVLPNLKLALNTSLAQTSDGILSSPQISTLDEDTLNVISLLFEFILEDRAIPAPIRALLARLQLPILKIAITDKTFFSKKNHSARRLLNSLAKVSTGWDYSKGTEDIIFSQIESIVETILAQFDTDISLFDQLNDQLEDFNHQQEKMSSTSEERITKATEGQELLNLAEQESGKIINHRLAHYSPVPSAVITLIKGSWDKVLRLRFLQKGKGSPEWEEGVRLMEQLLWSTAPKTDELSKQKLVNFGPTLLATLRNNLKGPSFNQAKINALFEELEACHAKCLNGGIDEDQLQIINKSEPVSAEQTKIASIAEEQKLLTDEIALSQAEDLLVGTWLEINNDKPEQAQRIKFSWRSNLTGRCLFVTSKGLKAADLALGELANWFQQGKAIILNQARTPIMERALISMKKNIKKQDNPAKD